MDWKINFLKLLIQINLGLLHSIEQGWQLFQLWVLFPREAFIYPVVCLLSLSKYIFMLALTSLLSTNLWIVLAFNINQWGGLFFFSRWKRATFKLNIFVIESGLFMVVYDRKNTFSCFCYNRGQVSRLISNVLINF